MEANRNELYLLVTEGKGSLKEFLLLQENASENVQEIADKIKSICLSLEPKKASSFIVNTLLPELYTSLPSFAGDAFINLAFTLIEAFPITLLEPSQIKSFKNRTKQSYVAGIEAVRKARDPLWSKLWMLLIRYLQRYLHSDVEFANSLFRIVESGFRVVSDRMGSYDCWKELINNYKLNEQFIKSKKHTKLLLTPLKVKFSGSELMVHKRFEVWVFLLKALNENASECLETFLSFSFGAMGEAQDAKNASHGLGKNCSLIWREATEVLLEIMGHRNLCENRNCWKRTDDAAAHEFQITIVNPSNFHKYSTIVVHSVIECTLLLGKWADAKTQKQVITCLWSTLLALAEKVQPEAATRVETKVYSFLANCAGASEPTEVEKNVTLCILKMSSDHSIRILKHLIVNKSEGFQKFLTVCCDNLEKAKFLTLTRVFSDPDIPWELQQFLSLWKWFSEFFTGDSNMNITPTDATKYLLSYTAILNSKELQKDQYKQWFSVFSWLCTAKPNFEHDFIAELKKHAKQNVVSVIALMMKACPDRVQSYDLNVLQYCWEALDSSLDSTTKNFTDLKDITWVMRMLLIVDLKGFSEKEQIHLVEAICRCICRMLVNHKAYSILDEVETFAKKLSHPLRIAASYVVKQDFPAHNVPSSDEKAQRALNIFNAMRPKKRMETPAIDLTRGARLTNMAKNSLGAAPQAAEEGKDERYCEIRKKVASAFPTVFGQADPKEDEYVSIDTEYKFDKSRLSAHQREQLRRRRDDIPSMYVDLSQDTQGESLSENSMGVRLEADVKAENNNTVTTNGKEKRFSNGIVDGMDEQEVLRRKPVLEVESRQREETPGIDDTAEGDAKTATEQTESPEVVPEEGDLEGTDGGSERDSSVSGDETEVQEDGDRTEDANTRRKGTTKTQSKHPKSSGLSEMEKEEKRRLSLKRELQRLKIDANYDSNIPTTVNSRLTRRSRNKIDVDPPMPPQEDNNSEVIESSQDSLVSIRPLSNTVLEQTTEKTEIETKSCASVETEKPMNESDVAAANKDTETCDPYEPISVDACLQLDEPKKPVLNESDRYLADKDTDTLTPLIVNGDDLPGSPVTVETPKRTSELLLNTSSISPIKTSSEGSAESEGGKSGPTAELKSPLTQKTLEDYMYQANNRSAKLLSLVSTAPPLKIRASDDPPDSVPVAVLESNRSKRMLDSVASSKQPEEATSTPETRSEEDNILTFSRELPSSSALPAGGSILKRKRPDFPDESPCVKRKRVNFPDPPTTSERLIIKGDEENGGGSAGREAKAKKMRKCKKQLDMNRVAVGVDEMETENETDRNSVEETETENTEPEYENDGKDMVCLPAVAECLRNTAVVNVDRIHQGDKKKASPEVVIKVATDALIKAVGSLDTEKEDHLELLRQSLMKIQNAMPSLILADVVHTILKNRRD